MTLPASRDRLGAVCDLVRDASEHSGFDERTNYACQLAVCEAVENIILHGYRDRSDGEIRIDLRSDPGRLTVEIVDDAPPFDPTRYRSDPNVSLQDPPVGGRGLLMIRRVMDAIDYERRRDRNHLRLTKTEAFAGA